MLDQHFLILESTTRGTHSGLEDLHGAVINPDRFIGILHKLSDGDSVYAISWPSLDVVSVDINSYRQNVEYRLGRDKGSMFVIKSLEHINRRIRKLKGDLSLIVNEWSVDQGSSMYGKALEAYLKGDVDKMCEDLLT